MAGVSAGLYRDVDRMEPVGTMKGNRDEKGKDGKMGISEGSER